MKKKVVLILFFIFASLFLYSVYSNWNNHRKDKSLYINDFENRTMEDYVSLGFDSNENITVGQCLTFLCREKGYNVYNRDEVVEFAEHFDVLLPSDLVYNKEDWVNLWEGIVQGNTLFEKVGEDTYLIDLVPNFLTIYLNQQGYDYIKKGLIPPQLYFYSPFSNVGDIEMINFNRKATLGFVLEVLMTLKVGENKLPIIRSILIEKVEGTTGIGEKDWSSAEIDIYNYYALNYYGELSYMKSNYDMQDMIFDNLNSSLSVSDFISLYNKTID